MTKMSENRPCTHTTTSMSSGDSKKGKRMRHFSKKATHLGCLLKESKMYCNGIMCQYLYDEREGGELPGT